MAFPRARYALVCALAVTATGCGSLSSRSPAVVRTPSVENQVEVSPETLARMADRFQALGRADKAQKLHALARSRQSVMMSQQDYANAVRAGVAGRDAEIARVSAPRAVSMQMATMATSIDLNAAQVPNRPAHGFSRLGGMEPVILSASTPEATQEVAMASPVEVPATAPLETVAVSETTPASLGNAITAATNRLTPKVVEPMLLVSALAEPDVTAGTLALASADVASDDDAPAILPDQPVAELPSPQLLPESDCPEAGCSSDENSEIVPLVECVRGLQHEDPKQRALAAFRLGQWGTSAAAALPELTHMLEHEQDPAVKVHLAEAMIKADTNCEPATRTLLEMLSHDSEKVRWLAAYALEATTASGNAEVVTQLGAALKDKDASVRTAAALTLGGFGNTARPAVPTLLRALQDENEEVRRAAALSLTCIVPEITCNPN